MMAITAAKATFAGFFIVAFPYDLHHLGQGLFAVNLTVRPIQVPVQLAPLFFGKPALMALFMLNSLVALAAQGLAGPLLRLLPPLRLQQRAKARALITGIRERRGDKHNGSSNQEQTFHQPVSVCRGSAVPGRRVPHYRDVPAAGPAGESLPRLTHPNWVLIT